MAVLIKRGRERVDLFSEMPRGNVLDIPAGGGEQSADLLKIGYKVFLADMFPLADRNRNLAWCQADANEGFPFRNEIFDYVLSREGVEHLENQARFIRECARVLKPGGKLVLTTPNIMHLGSRLSHFLAGQRILRRGLVNEVQTLRNVSGGRFYHGHVFLIDYFRLRYLLRLSGFDKIEVFTDRMSPTSIAFAWVVPILFAASKLAIKMSIRKYRKKGLRVPARSVFQEILTHVFSPALLFGKRMIAVAQKTSSAGDVFRD
ncbi:MAG: class I SAM-dependent methyltransferase [Candidatus Binatia bacterium]